MSNYEMIFKRKSIRTFTEEKFSQDLVNEINSYIKNELIPCKTGINIEVYFLESEKVSGLFKVKAPYYVIITSENKEDYEINAGFVLEQLVLWLTEKNIGTCWLGSAKPKKKTYEKFKLEYITMIACGYTDVKVFREDKKEFKRLQIDKICLEGQPNEYIEVARLAPSSLNMQPWRFLIKEDTIHVYKKKVSGFMEKKMEKEINISMGIALCHMYELSKEKNEKIKFDKQDENDVKNIEKYEYVISIKI